MTFKKQISQCPICNRDLQKWDILDETGKFYCIGYVCERCYNFWTKEELIL